MTAKSLNNTEGGSATACITQRFNGSGHSKKRPSPVTRIQHSNGTHQALNNGNKVRAFERDKNSSRSRHRRGTKPLDALKSLSELALQAPGLEPLVVYDAVAALAAKLAQSIHGPQGREMASVAKRAIVIAGAVREADLCEVDFREFFSVGGESV